jgi:GNAT superfamily N-acetyltransferase
MSMTAVTITLEDPTSSTALALMAALTGELEGRYDQDVTVDVTRMPELHNISSEGVQFVIAWLDGQPVGCGAVRPIDKLATEVKRMYVVPEARGRGIAWQILTYLETLAAAAGFTATRLETGIRQPEAVALYEKAGYVPIPCYGIYAQNPESCCFEKQLGDQVVPGTGLKAPA